MVSWHQRAHPDTLWHAFGAHWRANHSGAASEAQTGTSVTTVLGSAIQTGYAVTTLWNPPHV